jgi:D-alanyl-D-alanine carboxypeptidase
MPRCAFALLALVGACRHPALSDSAGARVGTETAPAPAQASAPAPALASAQATAPALASAQALASATAPAPTLANPFGIATPIPRYGCPVVQRGGGFRSYLAAADTKLAFVEGDEALALVNRSPTGALPPAYSPTDLVDLRDGRPRSASSCESGECLRRDAAGALKGMLTEMRSAKVTGYVVSSFRGFGTQCWVFESWAHKARGGFCEATEQSALPGHSQHQLGTTIDLFTNEWAQRGARTGEGVFRNGFGCSPGGQWLAENAWRFGFVLPYPIHPDDRKDGSACEARLDRLVPIDPKTGYKSEPWHLRFVGEDAAARYHEAWLASGPGTPDEITLEQWLRAGRGLVGDAELPVCDGCQCGACSTLDDDDAKAPCGKESLRLDEHGHVVAPAEAPQLLDTRIAVLPSGALRVDATVHAPPHTLTQPPVTTEDGPVYPAGSSYLALPTRAEGAVHRFADLPGAWRVAAEPASPAKAAGGRWPWRASLANPKLAETWNRANVVLPAKSGDAVVSFVVPALAGGRALRVALLRDGVETSAREIEAGGLP